MNHSRLLFAFLGLLAVILAIGLRQIPVDASAPPAGASLVGGCPATSSAYLPPDPTLNTSGISFCDGGDATVARIELLIPAHALDDNELVVAGYVDGTDVSLTLSSDTTGATQVVSQRAAECWKPVDATLPRAWHEGPIHVTLNDNGSGFSQWAGIGLRSRPVLSTAAMQMLLAAGIFCLLVAPLARPRAPHGDAALPARLRRLPHGYVVAGKCVVIFAFTLLVLALRRPDQFSAPYIWVEDGTVSLRQFLEHGWYSLLDPVAGYLILPSKLIHLTAMTLSAPHYPAIANWLNVCFHAGVLCAIALSPTRLRAPMLCALAALLIPTDAEVFATSHYAFWWGSLLLIPPLLWRDDADSRLFPRVAMTLLGGLSSPLTIVLLPLFALRLLMVGRTRNNTIISMLAAACAATQVYFLTRSHTHGTGLPTTFDLSMAVEKFLGRFVYGMRGGAEDTTLLLGAALASAMLAACWTYRKRLDFSHLVLVAALAVSVLVSIMRVPLDIIDPLMSGPRYFFYPFVFLAWLILQFIVVSPRHIALPLALMLASALLQTFLIAPRRHNHLDWQANLAQCASQKDIFEMPVHYDGSDTLWHVKLSPAQCAALSRQGIFH
ncbi:hypothetical protein [Stenotrophomonas indicatrix]|uniref:hypothetical protein n=1 Tax=Stenotrophomonas indicatrix TaxID=2045451 RepID=UPI0028AD8854|nr:hypothetical protein [Stenotrophomonas indicatrix]